jgi:hypothetical protein
VSVISAKVEEIDGDLTAEKSSEKWTYVVLCDSKTHSPVEVCLNALLPQIGDDHPTPSTGMKCKKASAKYDKESANPWKFEVDINFETPDPADDKDPEDPDEDPVEFTVNGSEVVYPMFIDKTDTLVQNSAGDTFDPPINGLEYDEDVVATRSQTTIVPNTIATYRGAVNSADFTVVAKDGTSRTFPAHTCRMGAISYSLQTRKDVQYWRVSYPWKYRKATVANPQPWKIRVLDEGLNQLDIDGETRIPVLDGNGRPITSPIKLDSATGTVASDQSPGQGDLLEFQDYVELDFGTLSLTN